MTQHLIYAERTGRSHRLRQLCTTLQAAFLLAFSSSVYALEPPQIALELVRVAPIDGIHDPSGLTFVAGKLYTVSDKDSDTVFALTIGDSAVSAVPAISIQRKETSEALDYEGIASDRDGFLVLSESTRSVMRVDRTGVITSTTHLDEIESGALFETPGAGPEGMALLPSGEVIVTGERQPAGLLVLDAARKPRFFNADLLYPKKGERPKDATGLWCDASELWCLSRNAEAIVCLDLNPDDFHVLRVLTFGHCSEQFSFSDNAYGTAEGIAADDNFIYMVLDNNGLSWKEDASDIRPMLLVFKRPSVSQIHAKLHSGD